MPAAKAAPKEKAEKPEVSVRDQVREMFQQGMTRSDLAEHFGKKYQAIYAMTKDLQGPEGATGGRPKVMVEVDGELRPRIDVIRERFANGDKIGAIAKDLGVSYQIVYQATKNLREAAAEAEDGESEDTEDTEDTEDEADEAEFDEDEEAEDE